MGTLCKLTLKMQIPLSTDVLFRLVTHKEVATVKLDKSTIALFNLWWTCWNSWVTLAMSPITQEVALSKIVTAFFCATCPITVQFDTSMLCCWPSFVKLSISSSICEFKRNIIKFWDVVIHFCERLQTDKWTFLEAVQDTKVFMPDLFPKYH